MIQVRPGQLSDFVAFEAYLLRSLEELLERPAETPAGRRLLNVLLDLLLETLPRELGLKSEEGYLEDVLREAPHLDGEIQKLRRDHVALWETLQRLRIEAGLNLPSHARQHFREEVAAWREARLAQQGHERRLVQESGGRDLGGEA